MNSNFQSKSHSAIAMSLMWVMLWCSFSITAKAQSEIEGTLNYVCNSVDCDSVEGSNMEASYALGVKFYRTIGSKFDELDYSLFLKGLKDAAKDEVTVDEETLTKALNEVIISEKDKSTMFLKKFTESTEYDVQEIDGVYVEKRPDLSQDLPDTSISDYLCDNQESPKKEQSSRGYRVGYARLKLDDTKKILWPSEESAEKNNSQTTASHSPHGCIDIKEREMIRGWRTVLKEMKTGDIWAVVIPPALAYGNRGVEGFVNPDVALYFILQLKEAPQAIF